MAMSDRQSAASDNLSQRFPATIIVPVRNEQGTVSSLFRGLESACLSEGTKVITVDDSDDLSTDVAVRSAEAELNSGCLSIRNMYRSPSTRWGSLAGAVTDGLRQAEDEFIVVMDADGQHPPETVPLLLEELARPGTDIVIASRYCQGGDAGGLESRLRHVASRSSGTLAKILFPWALRGVSDPMTGFFAVKRSALDLDRLNPDGFKILVELLARNSGLRRTEIPLRFRERTGGESKVSETGFVTQVKRYLLHLTRLRVTTLLFVCYRH